MQMVMDASQDSVDTALVISAYSDLVPAIQAVVGLKNRVLAVFAPELRRCQLQDRLLLSSGFEGVRPEKWRR